MIPSDWVRLQKGNDWGSDYYAINALIDGTASYHRGIKPEEGEQIHVLWEDGSLDIGRLKSIPYRTSVADMGHRNDVNGTRWYVEINYHGQKMLQELHEIRVSEKWARSRGAK